MFSEVEHLCKPGNPKASNEDVVGFGENYCFAIDGASSLSNVNIMAESDAQWFADWIGNGLAHAFRTQEAVDVVACIKQLTKQANCAYQETLMRKGLQEPEDSPSCGIALFYQQDSQLHFFGLGDCVGVAEVENDKLFYSLDTRLTNLDNGVLEEMIRIHQREGVSMKEARSLCNHLLIKNRSLRNQKGGYFVLDLSGKGISHARKKAFPLTKAVKVACFSDGFAQMAELFAFYKGYSGLFKGMQQERLADMYDRLYKAQDADADCNDYPRFKLRDDTCAVYGIFTP